MDFEIAIIGAGASGMMAGIAAASYFAANGSPRRIAIVERHPMTGRKLLATGNGLCNISNVHALPQAAGQYYYGDDTGRIRAILSGFTPDETVRFFGEIGVLCRTESDGRIYPFSSQSSAVRDALEARLDELGVVVFRSAEVRSVTATDDGGFCLCCEPADVSTSRSAGPSLSKTRKPDPHGIYLESAATIRSRKLIVAAGGKASAALSSDGLGYPLCTVFGHTITPLYPAIVRLNTQSMLNKDLSGVKIEAGLSLMQVTPGHAGTEERREIISKESGELLLTEDGISGPPVLQLAGFLKPSGGSLSYYVLADFFPGYTNEVLAEILVQRVQSLAGHGIERFFDGLLPVKLARAMAEKIFGTGTSRKMASVTSSEMAGSLSILKNLPFKITGTAGWENAQVTAGGVRLSEICCETMESRLCAGLYLTGELLDATGFCGGFNLQLAWASGHTAGVSAARQILAGQKEDTV